MTYGELRFNASKFPETLGADPDLIELSINNRIQQIVRRHRWKDLEADAMIVTIAATGDGQTCALTPGSTAVTGTAIFSPSQNGLKFKPYGRYESYTFTYVNASAGVLDRPYEGDDAELAIGFKIYQNVYALPADYGEPRDAVNQHLPHQLQYMSAVDLDTTAPARIVFGEPGVWSPATTQTDGGGNITRYAELYPIPEDAASYPLHYLRTVPRMNDASATAQLPSWISEMAVLYGVRADFSAGQAKVAYEAQYEGEIASMLRRDGAIRGPQHVRPAAVFTRHRMERVYGHYPRHW